MLAIRVSAATSSDGATRAPSQEELDAAALVLSVVDLPATMLRTLAEKIVRHTRQAVSDAERPLREALDANDIGECQACGAWINRANADDVWVDSVGLFCGKACASGFTCYCGKGLPGDEQVCGADPCVKRFHAEAQQ